MLCSAKTFLVSEPIGLKLKQGSGNIFLHAQLFAGAMYIAASICMFVLRAWKIGEIEELAAEQGKAPEQIDVVSSEPSRVSLSVASGLKLPQPSLTRLIIQWERV